MAWFDNAPFRLYLGLRARLYCSCCSAASCRWFAPTDPRVWQTASAQPAAELDASAGHHRRSGQDTSGCWSWSLRNSLILGVTRGGLLATVIGVFGRPRWPAIAGGWLDRVISFIMDALIVIPTLPILILMASLFGARRRCR